MLLPSSSFNVSRPSNSYTANSNNPRYISPTTALISAHPFLLIPLSKSSPRNTHSPRTTQAHSIIDNHPDSQVTPIPSSLCSTYKCSYIPLSIKTPNQLHRKQPAINAALRILLGPRLPSFFLPPRLPSPPFRGQNGACPRPSAPILCEVIK